MLYVLLFIFLAVVLWFVLKKKKEIETDETKEKMSYLPENATIKDVKAGGVISISGFTEDFQDLDFIVKTVNRYERGSSKWYELVGNAEGKKLFLEWEEDDGELFITATSTDKGFPLSDIGLSEDELIRMDEEASDENFVEYKDEKYFYDGSGEVLFYENNIGAGEGYYSWDFINEEETKVLSVERWEDEPFEVFTGKVIDADHVDIYKVK